MVGLRVLGEIGDRSSPKETVTLEWLVIRATPNAKLEGEVVRICRRRVWRADGAKAASGPNVLITSQAEHSRTSLRQGRCRSCQCRLMSRNCSLSAVPAARPGSVCRRAHVKSHNQALRQPALSGSKEHDTTRKPTLRTPCPPRPLAAVVRQAEVSIIPSPNKPTPSTRTSANMGRAFPCHVASWRIHTVRGYEKGNCKRRQWVVLLAVLSVVALVLLGRWLNATKVRGQQPAEPFRIAGNFYYVGANDVAPPSSPDPRGTCHRRGYPTTADVHGEHREARLRIKDVKVLLNSEPHPTTGAG